jgi:hypothetical protein
MSGWNITASSLAVPEIIIGEHIVRTDAQTGALVTVPVSAPVEQAPIPAIDIASIVESVLSAPIEIPGLDIMPLRSALSRLFSAVTDISGTRLPALSAANAVLEATTAAQEARLAAEEAGTQLQALKDAAQDAEQALNALNDSTVAASVSELSERIADISGSFGGRLASLEAVPAFDDSALRALIADVSGDVATVAAGLSAAQAGLADVSGAVATKAAASALEAVETRVSAVAEINVTFTSNGATVFEVVAGESVTLAKGAAGWSATTGIVPLASAPAPSEPSGGGGGATFPEAWSLLDDGGYTATLRTATLEEEEETEAELDGSVIVLNPAVPLESFRVWFEFGFGKVEAAALDGSRFYSPDFANFSLQEAAAVLITLSLDGSDEAVNHRVPITSVEGQ